MKIPVIDHDSFKTLIPYIDLAKPKSRVPWLFILTACRVCGNKRFQIIRALVFPVAA